MAPTGHGARNEAKSKKAFQGGNTMQSGLMAAGFAALFTSAVAIAPAAAQETPKRGGVLTYMIPADAPPSFDGHRETTYATVHATAPFYSVLIRLDPNTPQDTTKFVCDLCTEIPKPTDDGKTYTFKILSGVKWHDGSPLTATDVAASWNHIVHPPAGYNSARQNWYDMVDTISSPDPTTVVFHLKYATLTFLPALADPQYSWRCLQEGHPGQGSELVPEKHHGQRALQVRRLPTRPVDQG